MFTKICVVLSLIALTLGNPVVHRKQNIRIVGGNETTIEKNPWQVSIQILGLHNCGGSIIAPDTIVTAAHCIDLFITFYTVVAGSTDLSAPNVSVAIAEGFVHESYEGYDYDVGIIKLAENLTYSDNIQPIPLAKTRPETGALVKVSGYGVTWDGGILPSNILREVEVDIVSQEECSAAYAEYVDVSDREICAAVVGGGKDACQGDSGGPLVDEAGNLVGIVSWGMGCGEPGYPGVYADVAALRDWIVEKANL